MSGREVLTPAGPGGEVEGHGAVRSDVVEGPIHRAALVRLEEAEETLRAIGLGEIDAFVVSDGGSERRVFTLSTADRPYRRFVENMRDGAATVSTGGVILYANARLAELLACSRVDILGSRLSAFMDGATASEWDALSRLGDEGNTVQLDLVDVRGRAVPVLIGVSALGDDDDPVTCLTFRDLRDQRAHDAEIARLSQAQADRLADLQLAQAALVKQATHDALTGLPNREVFVDRLEQSLLRSTRTGGWTAVFFIDLDGFKLVNDTHGHATGNRVLREVAERLVVTMREVDTVARIGGDEFVALATDVASVRDAMDIGGRLVQVLGACPDGAFTGVCVSVGVAVREAGVGTAEVMLHEADTAMYQAKALGGGRVAIFDGVLAQLVEERLTAKASLRAALDENRITPYYQPMVDLASGCVEGFEALARLIEPHGNVLAPAAFIPVAEHTGLVVPLGLQMLQKACRDAALWPDGATCGGIAVAVNVSSRQLESGALPATVEQALRRTKLEPQRLHLELTETAIMDLHPEILRQLASIQALGVQIGLDDFGTGYASLTHLRRLPLDFVKIDSTFVSGLATDAGDERIVSAVVDLARNLGLRSVAEGVETPDQLRRLCELGCDQAQGYLLARPAPADRLTFDGYDVGRLAVPAML